MELLSGLRVVEGSAFVAAPLGGWAVQRIAPRTLMVAVGCLVIALSAWQIARAMKIV